MQRKSEAYKRLAGTYKATREAPLRPLAVLEADLDCARELLTDMKFNVSASIEAIRKHGMQMVFISKDKNANLIERVKSNPALRIQHEAVRHIKTLSIEIAFLEEQITRASKQKADDDTFAELFAN